MTSPIKALPPSSLFSSPIHKSLTAYQFPQASEEDQPDILQSSVGQKQHEQ